MGEVKLMYHRYNTAILVPSYARNNVNVWLDDLKQTFVI